MKRIMLLLLLLSLAPGCVSSMTMPWQKADKPPAKVEGKPPAPPTVGPDEIYENNALQKLKDLDKELDFAESVPDR